MPCSALLGQFSSILVGFAGRPCKTDRNDARPKPDRRIELFVGVLEDAVEALPVATVDALVELRVDVHRHLAVGVPT
jgi:hypothetical protein